LHLFQFWIGRDRDRERERDRERDKETVKDSKRDRPRDRQRNRQIEGDKGVNKYVTNNFVQPFLNFFHLRLWGKLD